MNKRGEGETFVHTMVERELVLTLILSAGHSVPVPARLSYRTGDPYAVHIAFHIDCGQPVHWTFARDLLIEGLFRPCGQGDVRVWPAKEEGCAVVLAALSSPGGEALVQAPAATVSTWLEHTLRLVPPGRESELLGLDEELADLLAVTPWDEAWDQAWDPTWDQTPDGE